MKRVLTNQSGVDFGETTTSRFSAPRPRSRESRLTQRPAPSVERRSGQESEGATLKDLSAEERAKIGKLIEQLAEAKESRERAEAERDALAKDLRQSTADFQGRLAEAVAACRRMEETLRQRETLVVDLESEKSFLAQRLEQSEADRIRLQRQLEDALNRADRLTQAQRQQEIAKENSEGLNPLPPPPKPANPKRPRVRKLIEPSLGKTIRLLQQQHSDGSDHPTDEEIEVPMRPIPKEPPRVVRGVEAQMPGKLQEPKNDFSENEKKHKRPDPFPAKKSVSNLMQKAKQIRQNQSGSTVRQASPPLPPVHPPQESDSDSSSSYLDHFIQKTKKRPAAQKPPAPLAPPAPPASLAPKPKHGSEPDDGFLSSPDSRPPPFPPPRAERRRRFH